jgi:hypothetical protein
MMYAGSVAKYSQVQLDGLLGIPASEANRYFESARDAAKTVIETGPYKLYNLIPDKAQNYQKLFFDETASGRQKYCTLCAQEFTGLRIICLCNA